MKIKVCGLAPIYENEALNELKGIDFLGFIFYPKSKRFTEKSFNSNKKKIGVFVDEETDKIQSTIISENLYAVQLHGNESPSQCLEISQHVVVIKAFNIETSKDFSLCKVYENKVDFFLFDSKSYQKGGSGKQFNWSILQDYTGNTPFFLSGGIGPSDVVKLKSIKHPHFYGIDINSLFESEPCNKNKEEIIRFINQLS
jgi:phosphoribosylanthranilate isomerase